MNKVTSRISLALLAALCFATIQCTKPDTPSDGSGPVPEEGEQGNVLEDPNFSNIRLEDQNNILRKTITFDTADRTECTVAFWKEEDKSDLVRSHRSQNGTHHEIKLIFMQENSTYNWQISKADGTTSKVFHFKTGYLENRFRNFALPTELEVAEGFGFDGYILYQDKESDFLLMLDDKANIVWYELFDPAKSKGFNYDPRTRTISLMHGTGPRHPCVSNLTCFDLYGNKLLEGNTETMKNNLMHHDSYRMKDGNWIYIHFVTKDFYFPDKDQTLTVTGDGLTIINEKNEILWEWNCFDHLNPVEDPHIMDIVPKPVITDWMHCNSIVEDEKGDLYVSSNRMKQIIKIKRETGEIVYRAGYNGNVTFNGEQENELKPDRLHSLQLLENGELLFFENGGKEKDRSYSRIMSYKINEENKTADVITNIQLPNDMKSSFNSNAYTWGKDHYIVHSTEKRKTIIMDKNGNVKWAKPVGSESFRAVYVEPEKQIWD